VFIRESAIVFLSQNKHHHLLPLFAAFVTFNAMWEALQTSTVVSVWLSDFPFSYSYFLHFVE